MKDFRDFIVEVKGDGYSEYKKNLKISISGINKLIEYGRKTEVDNRYINPLLDALKGLHLADDAIRGAYEKTIEPEPEEDPVEPEPEDKW